VSVLADMGTSLIVMGNGLRPLRLPRPAGARVSVSGTPGENSEATALPTVIAG